MEFVFLLVRLLFGSYMAHQGARRLSAYGRHQVIADAESGELMVIVQGLLALTGGVCVMTGIGVTFGVAATLAFIASISIGRRGSLLLRNAVFAAATLLFLAAPRPWPFTFVG